MLAIRISIILYWCCLFCLADNITNLYVGQQLYLGQVLTTVPAVYSNVPTTGLVGYWKFDDGTGITAVDSSGNSNPGTLSIASWTNGISGGAWYGYGENDISIADSVSLRGTSGITIAFWAFTTNINQSYGMFLSKGGGVTGFEIDTHGATGIIDGMIRISGASEVVSTGRQMPNNQWWHYAITFDGSNINVLTNGVLAKGPVSKSGTIENPSDTIYIGSRSGANELIGFLDDLRIYDRGLDATEVLQLYQHPGAVQ